MTNVIPLNPRQDPRTEPVTEAPIGRAVYTVAEAADLLALSLGSTYAMVRSGQIPAKRMGGRWVIPKRRFHAWLDELPEATTEDVARELAKDGNR